MFSKERAKELLKGAIPINQDEIDFISNFDKSLEADIAEMQKKDEFHRQEMIMAYREYYSLIMEILPKEFLYKSPINYAIMEAWEEKTKQKIEKKILGIVFNPLLRKLNGLDPHLNGRPDGESASFDILGMKFLKEAYKKNYGIDIDKLENKYLSYFTPEVIERIDKIGKKYHTHLFYSFEPTDYLTNWERFDV